MKNLSKLNRDLSKVIVVDWNRDAVRFHPENVFNIKPWEGDDDDKSLIDLAAFLVTVANNKVEDVRDVLTYYSKFDDGLAEFRERQVAVLERSSESKSKERSSLARNWVPRVFSGYARS